MIHARPRRVWLLLPGLLIGVAKPGLAQPSAGAGAPDVTAQWPLESVSLTSGKHYRGLIDTVTAAEVDFFEVRRSPGKPMHLVWRSIDRKMIESWQRLDAAAQQTLREHVAKFKKRALIEAKRMEDLNLTPLRRDGTLVWQYQGQWFVLESTADESTTRRSVVRIEQVFAAYRQILPPRELPRQPLQLMIFGSTSQYRLYLRGLGLEIANPAFFAADFNVLAAASDMNLFGEELAKVRREHQAVRAELEADAAQLPARLKELNGKLRVAELPAPERQKIVVAEQGKWEDRRKQLLRRIVALDRKNAARFDEVAGKMFARLYHEAFHAYLENCVYPHHQYDVPRWLNEGLAQTFEVGLLEDEVLRVDVPNRPALAQVQRDLKGADPLPLAELLSAGASEFLPAHRGAADGASRLYAYSWGLAYFLTFERPVLGTKAFDEFVNPAAGNQPPKARFEKLVGMPLAEFETRWRASMLELK